MEFVTLWGDFCLRVARLSTLAGEVVAQRTAMLAPGAAPPAEQMMEAARMTIEKPIAALESLSRMSRAPAETALIEALAPFETRVAANARRLRAF